MKSFCQKNKRKFEMQNGVKTQKRKRVGKQSMHAFSMKKRDREGEEHLIYLV